MKIAVLGSGNGGITSTGMIDRYLNENVGYGLIFMSELGKQVGVETPAIDAIIKLTSIILIEIIEEKRTMETLGSDKYNLSELLEIL